MEGYACLKTYSRTTNGFEANKHFEGAPSKVLMY